MTYIAQMTITHSRTGALIQPGEAVDVSHLTPDELLMVLGAGMLAETCGGQEQPVLDEGTGTEQDGTAQDAPEESD